MLKRLLIACACLVTTSGGFLRAEELTFVEGEAQGTITLVTEPSAGQWDVEKPIRPGQRVASSKGYELRLERDANEGHAVWTMHLSREDGAEFRVKNLGYACRTALGRVATVFDTQSSSEDSLFRQAPELDAAIEVRPNRGIPFMMGCDHYGNNAMAIGAMDQTGTYRITGRRIDGDYGISIVRREYEGDRWFTGTAFTDAVFISTQPSSWYATARGFADRVDAAADYASLTPHPKADLPYYSTWYALGDKIDQSSILAQAELASEMGCGNFLIFIGWSVCENWFSSENRWGDYTPCPSRFEDFAGMVRTIQDDLGMAVEVWVSPTWIGAGSESFADMAEHRSKWPDGGYDRNLDPRSPAAREHIRERFAFLAEEYGVDGIYVDFLDTLWNRNDADHPMQPRHFGSGLDAFLASMAEGFTSAQPKPIIEYRMPFANLLTKRYATVFTTTYTEGDWQRSRIIAMSRRAFSKGVINRCDPLVWTVDEMEDRDGVGKALSAMCLLGPPGISMDLTRMSPEERERVARWFRFFREHREKLVHGEFIPFGDEYHHPEMIVHHGNTAYAWISRWQTGHIPLPRGTTHAFLFTALPTDVSFISRIHPGHITGLVPGQYAARWFDSSMESHDGWFEIEITGKPRPQSADAPLRTPRENWDFHPGDEGVPSLDVRRGGFLELKRKG